MTLPCDFNEFRTCWNCSKSRCDLRRIEVAGLLVGFLDLCFCLDAEEFVDGPREETDCDGWEPQ